MNSNRKIWKYPLELTDVQQILMPADSKILTAKIQDGAICLWVSLPGTSDMSSLHQPINIRIAGTGHPEILPFDEYIDTVISGTMVWHIFKTFVEVPTAA